jgi:hypothetical protein
MDDDAEIDDTYA